jgi:hypothetical protein
VNLTSILFGPYFRRIHPLGRWVNNPSGEDVTEAREPLRLLPAHPATQHP